jgi:hypothetical protein
MDQLLARVHRPVVTGSEVLVDMMKSVQTFAILAMPWCLLEPFAWSEL